MAGVYIHIPFCRQACHYCNFHFSTSLRLRKEMTEALVKEIGITAGRQDQTAKNIETLYFGGGTPSLLNNVELEQVFEALHKHFVFADDIEVTLEANPDDISAKRLYEWRSLGINRFSVGIQSFLDKELQWMNRAHNSSEALQSIDLIREAGFTNFSADLIYGSPLLSDEDWKKNADLLFEKGIPHISCYALTVEPKTALDKMIALKKKEAVDPEKQARQFTLLMDWMNKAGYEHYEISNFARPGMRSKHNSSYWQGIPYFGFGPSAHSFDGKSRKWNIANNALYIQSIQKGILPFEEELLTSTQMINEYIMTALRTIEGLDLDLVKERFGESPKDDLVAGSLKWQKGGKLLMKDSKLVLTREGKLYADGIASDLFMTAVLTDK